MEQVHMVVNNFLKICLISLFFILSSPVFADTYGEGTYGSERYSGNNSTTTAPGIPTSVIATAGNAQVSVSFTPPGNNGGIAITSYVVTSSPGNISAAGPSSPIVITGLSNGTTYTFTVIAINSVGSSTPSATSVAVTPSIPPAPQTGGSGFSGGSTSGSSYVPASLINTLITKTPTQPVVNETVNQIKQNVEIGLSNFNNNLLIGTVNTEIKSLQQFLNKQGFIVSSTGPGSIGSETTLFGPATKAALAKFQKANNISPAVGYFGPITRLLVNTILDSDNNIITNNSTSTTSKLSTLDSTNIPIYTRDLELNMLGDDVKSLQQFLNKQGFIVSSTGPGSIGSETTKFGPATKAALIRFQTANNISPAVGYFGPITRALVNSIN